MTEQATTIPTRTYETIETFAERLKIHKSTVRRLIKEGLPVVRIGDLVRIPLPEADLFLLGAKRRTRTKRTIEK